MRDATMDANGPARWKERQNALAWERPAKAAIVLAVFASLGALFAWTILLVQGNDIRFSGRFWLIAALPLVWWGPVQATSRWAMRTLWLALLLWPALALAALVAVLDNPPSVLAEHANATLVEAAFGVTVAMSVAGLACLRASSLPGGTATPEFHDKGYRPSGALPSVDPLLVDAQRMLMFPLIPVILMGSGAGAAFTVNSGQSAADAASQAVSLMMVFGGVFIAAFVALLLWGQYQARRWPARLPTGLLGLGALVGGTAVALTAAVFWLGVRTGNDNLAVGGMFMALVAHGVLWAEATAYGRLLQRMRGTR